MNYSSVLSLSSQGDNNHEYKAHLSHSSTPSKKSSSNSSSDDLNKSKENFEIELLNNDKEKFGHDSSSFMDKKYQLDHRELTMIKKDREYSVSPFNVVMAAVAYLILSISIFLSNYVYSINKLTPWEDIYGKSVVGTLLSYLVMKSQGISPFELYSHVRVRLFMMQGILIIAL